MFQDLTSLVVNVGTYSSKIGYGGDDSPKIVCPSFVGKPSNSQMISQGLQNSRKYLVGSKYLSLDRTELQIQSIFRSKNQHAYQLDYDKFQTFLAGLIHDNFHINLSQYSVLFGEDMAAKPHQLRNQRASIAQIMFQKLNIPNIYFCKNPVLSCFATGRSTALVLDSGQNYTKAVSVHDGYALYKSAKCSTIAGKTISREVKKYVEKIIGGALMSKQNLSGQQYRLSYSDYQMNELLKDIKQHLSVRSPEEGMQEAATKIEYELPDGKIISLDKSEIVDPFVNPTEYLSLNPQADVQYKGFPQMIVENINMCDVDIKKQLYSNILMVGGNMLYDNLGQLIQSKVSQLAPPNAKVRSVAVVMPSQRKFTEWIGGSIVTSLSSFQSYWVGKQEWKELGSSIIQKKCT